MMRNHYKDLSEIIGAKLLTCLPLGSAYSIILGFCALAIMPYGLHAQQNFQCEWAKSIGGTQGTYEAEAATDNAGNVYFGGLFRDTLEIDQGNPASLHISNGQEDIVFCKFDYSGAYKWSITLGGLERDGLTGIAVDKNGDVFITGYFRDTVDFDPGPGNSLLISSGNNDMFLAKYDKSGNHIWAFNIGGPYYEEGSELALDTNGNVYVTGFFTDTIDFDPGPGTSIHTSVQPNWMSDVFICKYNGSGSLIWAQSIVGYGRTYAHGIAVDPERNRLVVIGAYQDSIDLDPDATTANWKISNGSDDFYLTAYDLNGNYQWGFGIGGQRLDRGRDIVIDKRGNIAVTGHFEDIVDFDPNPGNISNLASAGVNNIFLAKYDMHGNYLWAKSMGGPGHGDHGEGVALDIYGNIYLTGGFADTADFDPGPGVANFIGSNNDNTFLAQYDSNGNYKMGFGIDGVNHEYGESISIDNSIPNKPKIYIACWQRGGVIDYEPGLDSVTINNTQYHTSNVLVSYFPPCADVSGPTLSAGLCPEDTINYGNLTITSPGTYTAAFPAANGCDSLVELTVINAPAHTQSNTASICGGEVYVFDTIELTTSGTYTQTYQNVHGCDSVVTLILTVNEIDTSNYITNVHTLIVNQGFAAYQWVDCDANYTPISGATNQSFTPTENGNYAVIVTTADGCTDTSACRTITNVGIEDIPGVGSIQLYPNPAAGTVYLEISADNPMDLNLHLQDSRGRLVYERVLGQVAGAHTYELPLDGVAAGVYHVVLYSNEGHSVRKLIVIE